MSHDHHDHERPGAHDAPLSGAALRVKALESLLTEKGLVNPKALDELIDTYETRIGPRNGARIVSRAWVDPAFRERLFADATEAIAEFGYIGRQGEDMVILARPGMSADLDALPAIPRDAEGPVFRAPWEAQAFAMAVKLHEAGHFTWKEWAERLAREIAAARERGEQDDGSRYYEYWLATLEKLVADKRLVLDDELATRRDEWATAARETPHGQPIELHRGGRHGD